MEHADLAAINSVLDSLVYGEVSERDLARFGSTGPLKLFRLSQLALEYLLHSQEYLLALCRDLDLEYKHTLSSLKHAEQ